MHITPKIIERCVDHDRILIYIFAKIGRLYNDAVHVITVFVPHKSFRMV